MAVRDAAARERARIMAKARKSGTMSLSKEEIAKLTPGQRDKIGLNATGADTWSVPGSTKGGTDFSTVPQTPGAVSGDGRSIVPVGTPSSTVPPGSSPGSSLIASNIGGLVSGVLNRRFDGYAPDSFYNEALSTIAANRRRALDAATEGERGLSGDFGLGIVQDEGGARFSGQWAASDANMGGIDPSNPFSRASLLNKSYFAANKVGEGAYANRGLLTSGAYQRSQQRNAFGFEQGRDQLLRQFASGLQGYRDRRSQAESDASTQGISARNDLYQRNRDNYDRMYPS